MFYLLILLLQMKLIRKINDLNKAIKNNFSLGFVPTMGGLHNGHKSLIKLSKKKCKKTLVSIFINPKQFNNKLDYKNYPRNFDKDIQILKKLNVDFIYLPSEKEVFKNKKIPKTKLIMSQKILCAKYRKGHFEGVLDVMNRFINIIKPKYVFMGEKDYQQFFLVKSFLEPKYNTKIIPCKTIRNNKGSALSTRNFLLNKSDMKKTAIIANNLKNLKKKISKNKSNSYKLIQVHKKKLIDKFEIKIEYLEVRNIVNLGLNIKNKDFKIFIAYYIDNVRLIDNF